MNIKDKLSLGKDTRTALGKAVGVFQTFFYAYVVICVIYTTLTIIANLKGLNIEIISPLG